MVETYREYKIKGAENEKVVERKEETRENEIEKIKGVTPNEATAIK